METVESHRKMCLERQTELRRVMLEAGQFDRAIQLFLSQHTRLHSREMARTEAWSFADEVLDDLPEEKIRRVPPGADHSAAWLIWHMARCEDITMNLLVAGSPQVLHRDNWLALMKTNVCDTGNAMDRAGLADFSNTVDLEALRAYRLAVGRRTQEIARVLGPQDLTRKVQPSRIQRVMDEGAVLPPAYGIVEYWSKRDVAGLLLMPATRHNLIHLNEAYQIKRSRR